jgi:hypothetical protein
MSEKEIWLQKTQLRLNERYGGRGVQMYDLCQSGAMTKEDAKDYILTLEILAV